MGLLHIARQRLLADLTNSMAAIIVEAVCTTWWPIKVNNSYRLRTPAPGPLPYSATLKAMAKAFCIAGKGPAMEILHTRSCPSILLLPIFCMASTSIRCP